MTGTVGEEVRAEESLDETVAPDVEKGENNGNDERLTETVDEKFPDEELKDEDLDGNAQIAKLQEEKSALQDQMLRMAAELENFKKRMTRERDTTLKYAAESLIRDLLPTLDNLERALDHEPEGDIASFMEGVDMTLKGLLVTLEKSGLSAIQSVGEPFDPNIHEALVMEASKEIPEQSIIREFEKGYYYKDRLLRAAKVVVSKGDV